MMRVLTEEESFQLLRARFDSLKPFDLLELSLGGRRIRAVVSSVDKKGRTFAFVELNDRMLRKIAREGRQDRVVIPESSDVPHPMWNVIPRG